MMMIELNVVFSNHYELLTLKKRPKFTIKFKFKSHKTIPVYLKNFALFLFQYFTFLIDRFYSLVESH